MRNPKCAILGCPSSKIWKQGVLLHKFPKCPKRFKKWIDIINSPLLRALKQKQVVGRYRVCHLHFEPRFTTDKKRVLACAVPTLFQHHEIVNKRPDKDFDVPTVEHQSRKLQVYKHNDHNYYKLEEDFTEELQPTVESHTNTNLTGENEIHDNSEPQYNVTTPEENPSTDLEPDHEDTGDPFVIDDFMSACQTEPPEEERIELPAKGYIDRGLTFNILPEELRINPSEEISAKLAASVNKDRSQNIIKQNPKPKASGDSLQIRDITNTENVKPTAKTKATKQVTASPKTEAKYETPMQRYFSTFLADDRKARNAWKRSLQNQKKRQLANRKEMTMYRNKEARFNALPKDVQTFINMQLYKRDKKHRNMKYTDDEVTLSQKIYTECPIAYKYMSKMFHLPSKKSLRNFALRRREEWKERPFENVVK